MKKVFTLTATLSLAALILVFTAASAANLKDDTSKCKKRCCKDKEIEKEVKEAVAVINASMKSFVAQMQLPDFSSAEFVQAFASAPITITKNGRTFIIVTVAEPNLPLAETTDFYQKNQEMDKVQESMSQPDADKNATSDQKIDFNNIGKEMNNVQENLSQMDSTLKKDEIKSQKKAETILKTGIRS